MIGSGVISKVLVFALAFVLLSSGGVQATHGDDGQPISGASPLPLDCNPVAQADGTYHLEMGPHLAVNPTDPDNIAVAWTQDAADGIVVGVSHDGGNSWAKSVPPTSLCTGGGEYTSAFTQHLSFGPEGRLYLSVWNSIASASQGTRIAVHHSTDGGDTWSPPVTVKETAHTDLERTNHYSWVVADPTRPGTVYATWMKEDDADAINSFPAYDMGLARSTDGGVTWSAPQDISPAPAGYDRLLPQVVVLPDGSLVNVFLQARERPLIPRERRPQPGSVMAARSTDRGATWSTPVEIASREIRADDDPRVQKLGMGAEHALVNLPAVSRDGTIYYAWPRNEPDDSSTLHLASSSDGGLTWATRVIRESDVPMAVTNIATVGGKVGILFYDLRNDAPGDDQALADVWFISAPAGALGLGAWRERHVAGPFDVNSLPTLARATLGSNQGIAGTPEGFVSSYTLAEPLSTVGATDVFFARMPSHP